jgi:hypothetical protein
MLQQQATHWHSCCTQLCTLKLLLLLVVAVVVVMVVVVQQGQLPPGLPSTSTWLRRR